jgi:hypothetical protein
MPQEQCGLRLANLPAVETDLLDGAVVLPDRAGVNAES